MSDEDPQAVVDSDDENFPAPAKLTIDDIINAGKEDESLKTYAETLLGWYLLSSKIMLEHNRMQTKMHDKEAMKMII